MMDEMRLIDAQALAEELSSLSVIVTGLRAGKGFLHECMTEYRKSVLRIVDEAKTIDAVPVVRCKDCKRFVEDKEAFVTYCNLGCDMRDVGHEDFCSYGERRKRCSDLQVKSV